MTSQMGSVSFSHSPRTSLLSEVSNPGALTRTVDHLQEYWGSSVRGGRRWRPGQSVLGRRALLLSAAWGLGVPWGSPRGRPGVHTRPMRGAASLRVASGLEAAGLPLSSTPLQEQWTSETRQTVLMKIALLS